MERECPKCGFRNANAGSETTAACPSCGVIYAKAALVQAQRRAAAQYRAAPSPERVMWPWLLALAAIIMIGVLTWQRTRAPASAAPELTPEVAAAPAVTPQQALQRVDREKQARESAARALETARETYRREHDAVSAQVAKWDTADRIARATGRIALAEPVKDLAGLARETHALPLTNGCLIDARDKLAGAMDTNVTMYIAFMQQASTYDLQKSALSDMENALAALQRCTAP